MATEMVSQQQYVRILNVDGHVSKSQYLIEVDKPDRKGFVLLKNEAGDLVKVNQRRVLKNCDAGDAFVIEVGDKFRAVCPNCTYVQEVTPNCEFLTCPTHGQTKLHWKEGERPVTDIAQNESTSETAEKPEVAPTSQKKETKSQSQQAVNFDSLKSHNETELWTKKGIRFDHSKIDAQAHVLLFVGDNPRKLCFNTYDGNLGKKAKSLPIEEFLKNEKPEGFSSWYDVKNIEKAKTDLTSKNYEKQ